MTFALGEKAFDAPASRKLLICRLYRVHFSFKVVIIPICNRRRIQHLNICLINFLANLDWTRRFLYPLDSSHIFLFWHFFDIKMVWCLNLLPIFILKRLFPAAGFDHFLIWHPKWRLIRKLTRLIGTILRSTLYPRLQQVHRRQSLNLRISRSRCLLLSQTILKVRWWLGLRHKREFLKVRYRLIILLFNFDGLNRRNNGLQAPISSLWMNQTFNRYRMWGLICGVWYFASPILRY